MKVDRPAVMAVCARQTVQRVLVSGRTARAVELGGTPAGRNTADRDTAQLVEEARRRLEWGWA